MALLTTGNTRVEAPAFVPAKGGILDVVEVVTATPHELMGVEYESEACEAVNHVLLDVNSCIESANKDFDGIGFEQGAPFHIYAGVECSLFMESIEPFASKAAVRLDRGASRAIEERLWTNEFPDRAVDLTPGGVAVSPKRGLAILEEYAGSNYLGVPIVHAGRQVATYIAGETLLTHDLGEASVAGGAGFVNGAGYTSKTGPAAVVATANQAWMYATGHIVIRRSAVTIAQAVGPASNDMIALAEQTIVPTIDCFVAAILVNLS